MPELPDVTVYVERLTALLLAQPLTGVLVRSPFVLRSVEPPLAELVGRRALVVQADEHPVIVLHVDDMHAASRVLRQKGLELIGQDDLAWPPDSF